MKRSTPFASRFLALGVILLAYAASYLWRSERNASRARLAGEFFHYRIFSHDWEARFFLPAAMVEWSIIQGWPRPFLPHPSWDSLPQSVIVQGPSFMRKL